VACRARSVASESSSAVPSMGNAFNGTQTPEQGAAIAIRLATLPDDGPTGGLLDDTGIVPW
jgi:hypothetical protein